VPLHGDRALFELLTLEGAQAGLAWITILRKREAYRRAFAGFEPRKVAGFDRRRVASLLRDPGIVRNRAKLEGTVQNARALLKLRDEGVRFDRHLWSFVGGRPLQGRRRSMKDVPAETEESRRLSKDLKKRGFTFVGPTICYAFMQAAGLVNDHVTSCFRHASLSRSGRSRS
jgi:DNA-3-methyladenine glycosylase I